MNKMLERAGRETMNKSDGQMRIKNKRKELSKVVPCIVIHNSKD